MLIIPAIDIIGGQCVRLEKGDYAKRKVYSGNPLEVAQSFEQAGITHLHLVDLDGAKAKHVVNIDVLESITSQTNLKVDFGGGVKANVDVEKVFAAGASQITGGSVAAQNRELFLDWLSHYGGERIILGADVLEGKIMVSGWQQGTSIDLMDYLADYTDQGISYVICTDISKDGMLAGPSIRLYREVLQRFPELRLIASGGVSSADDLARLQDAGLYAAIVGKAIYEDRITLDEIAQFR